MILFCFKVVELFRQAGKAIRCMPFLLFHPFLVIYFLINITVFSSLLRLAYNRMFVPVSYIDIIDDFYQYIHRYYFN